MNDFDHTVLEHVDHRPWAIPAGPWFMTQTWRTLLFAHWPLDPKALRPRIPPPLTLDVFQETAWISIVPFVMDNVGPRGLSAIATSAFPELNVRTYVTHGGRPGVFFFSLDAASMLAVRAARLFFNLPYHHATMTCRRNGATIDYHSRRDQANPPAAFAATFAPDREPFVATPGSLDYFLTERYCLYHLHRSGRAYRLEIDHPAWQLHRANVAVTTNTMAAVNGIALPDRLPLAHYAGRQDVVAWWPTPL